MNGVSRFTDSRRLGRGASFTVLVLANVLLMASASAPSPIYPLYLQRWGFSVTMLTVIFAVYVAGLLGALLTVGSLSDHLGRRPVLVASLLVAAASTAIFWAADGIVSLVAARVVQGVATGMATGALAAGLVEFSPGERPRLGPTMTAVGTSFGLATGGGVVGLVVQATPHPDAYVFPALTLAFVALAALVLAIPEPVARRAGGLASLRPRVRVPRETRPEFLAAVPAIAAGWSVTGLFLALAPSLVSDVLHVRFAAAPVVFIGGSVIAGLGVGLTFNGTLRGISAATSATSRSEVFSAAYVISYAALSLPSLAAGLVAPSRGLGTTGYLYIAFVGVLSLSAAVHAGRMCTGTRPMRPQLRRRRRAHHRADHTRSHVREDAAERPLGTNHPGKETTCKRSPCETRKQVSVGSR